MIAILDFGLSNTTDLELALSKINAEFIVTNKETEITGCDKVIIYNADEVTRAMKKIHLLNLFSLLRMMKKPTLGISLGLELLCDKSEDGTSFLGLFPLTIKKFSDGKNVGWHEVKRIEDFKLFANIKKNEKFYFDHSYYAEVGESTIATVENEIVFSAAIHTDYYCGIQFLPEKSGEQGLQFLRNFVEVC